MTFDNLHKKINTNFLNSKKIKNHFLCRFFTTSVSKVNKQFKLEVMKNLLWLFILTGVLILPGISVVQATETEPENKQITQTVRPGFTDTNGDGICDFYDGKRPGQGFGPGNGEGMGQNSGKGLGKGLGLRDGSGNGQRRLYGSGNGRNKGNGKQLRDGSGGYCRQLTK